MTMFVDYVNVPATRRSRKKNRKKETKKADTCQCRQKHSCNVGIFCSSLCVCNQRRHTSETHGNTHKRIALVLGLRCFSNQTVFESLMITIGPDHEELLEFDILNKDNYQDRTTFRRNELKNWRVLLCIHNLFSCVNCF